METISIKLTDEQRQKLLLLSELSGYTPERWLAESVVNAARIADSLQPVMPQRYKAGAMTPGAEGRLPSVLSLRVPTEVYRRIRSRPNWTVQLREYLTQEYGGGEYLAMGADCHG